MSMGNSLPSIDETETPTKQTDKNNRKTHRQGMSALEDEVTKEEEKREKDKEWVLKDFDSISEALYTGRVVFYNIELTACALPPQNKVERLSFGDFIDDFEISPRDKKLKKKAFVRLWQTKYIQGEEGMEELIREITVLSNGRVQVRLIRKHSSSEKVAWDHVAQCKLYDPESGLGGVKFTTQPSAEVQEITTYGRLRAALRRGRRQVRMILDLAQCEGRTHGSKPLVGFTVRAYDYINSGKAIEITRLTQDATHPGRQLFTGHFLHNGEVIFITSPQLASAGSTDSQLPFQQRDATHRCALTSGDVRRNSWPSGVRLFYT
ncbi:uncharacterized protein LOC112560572 [Pomacea canaliculata]|nr:uncharacterized protein LOC112560572 [Pomacea canaliculata]